MSRWFRHYAGMMRDDKLVRVALKSRQTVERVVWVWGAILEAGADHDRSDIRMERDEWAAFLGCSSVEVADVISGLERVGYLSSDGSIALWSKFRAGRYDDFRTKKEWHAIRHEVFVRDNFTCQYCGAYGVKLQCDHVHPISKGGSSTLDNLKTACMACNQSKRDKALDAWLAERAA